MANTSFVPISLQSAGGKTAISATEVTERSFKHLNITEADLEEFVRQNIEVLFPDSDETLLIVGQQIKNKEAGRADLVALDGQGNTVLIELKRDKEDITARKEAFEFQAIRYAASYALLKSPQDIVQKLYAPYIGKHQSDALFLERLNKGFTSFELGNRIIEDFLRINNISQPINRKQRIILIASSYDPQTLSACAWLAANGIDIRCIAVLPIEHNNQYFFQIEQVIPPTSIEDYLIEIDEPSTPSKSVLPDGNKGKRAILPRMAALMEWGVLHKGDVLFIKEYEQEKATVVDARQVSYKERMISYNQWGQEVTGWASINIYEWAVQESTNKTLGKLRREKLEQQIAVDTE